MAILIWNIVAWVLWGAAVIEVIRTPTGRFAHGWRTKVSRLVVISVLSVAVAGLFLPFGAVAVLGGLRRSAHQAHPIENAAPQGPRLPG